MADSIPSDFQSQIAKLTEIAKVKGDDFRIKIMRKASPAAPLTSVATFDGAQIGHFAVPEAWLIPFCGGGPVFVLWAYHASEPNTIVETIYPPSIVGPIRDPVNFAAVTRPDWTGPTTLLAPRPPQAAAPATNTSLDPSTLFNVPGAPPASGGPARDASPPAPGSPGHSSDVDRLHTAQLAILDQQRRNDTERMEKMIEAQAKAMDRQLAALADLVKSVAQRPPEKPAPSLGEQIVPLVAAATPILTALLARGDADRKTAMERESRREEREAKAREEANKVQALLLEKMAGGNTETAKVMQSMADVVANSMKAQLQTFATLRELMPGEPPDEGITGILKALAPAAAEYFAAKGAAQPATPALPPRPPPPAPPAASPPATGLQPGDAAPPAADSGLASMDPAALLAEIDTAIHAHHDAAELAAGYVEALATNPGFKDLVAQAGGTIALFQQRLGSWVMDRTPAADGMTNGNYLRALVGALNGAAAQRGVTV